VATDGVWVHVWLNSSRGVPAAQGLHHYSYTVLAPSHTFSNSYFSFKNLQCSKHIERKDRKMGKETEKKKILENISFP
jgi:hypothetical protein